MVSLNDEIYRVGKVHLHAKSGILQGWPFDIETLDSDFVGYYKLSRDLSSSGLCMRHERFIGARIIELPICHI